MKRILITTDFSLPSKAGIRFAVQMASQCECELLFYNVNNPETIQSWTDVLYTPNPSEKELRRKRMIQFTAPLVKSVTGDRIEWVADDGVNTAEAIVAYARKWRADFICMGTRGLGGLHRFFGSTAASLMATSPIPLLLVPHSYRVKPIKSLLYASDFEEIRKELDKVTQFAQELGLRLSVYHYEAFLDEAEVKQKLYTLAAELAPQGPAFHFKKLHIEHSLLDHLTADIRRTKPSLIALFTKQNRNWFDRLFLSSKTAELGFDTRTPLLVFRK